VGGDFYDVFDNGRRGWGIVMGDVQGKGADAAAVTALARYTLRAAVAQDTRPSGVLRVLNDAILRQGEETGFCTAIYACLEDGAPGRSLKLASAGHPLPLVLRPDGRVRELGSPGTLLGAVANPELHDHEMTIEPGSALVFYTDGVLDAGSPERYLTLEELMNAIRVCAGRSAHEIAEAVDRAALERSGGSARDDIAILVLRLAPTPLPRRVLRAARRLRRRRDHVLDHR
jgi:serine phosphatase RsbU (regulator of sigma subunit)